MMTSQNSTGLSQFRAAYRNSVADIRINFPIVLDHWLQVFDFFNEFD